MTLGPRARSCARGCTLDTTHSFSFNLNTERSLSTSPSGIVAGLNNFYLFFHFHSHSFVAYLFLSHQHRHINTSRLALLKGRQSKPSFPLSPFCVFSFSANSLKIIRASVALFVLRATVAPFSLSTSHDRAYLPAVERLTTANPPPP